jgi:hypothetical protein
VGTGGAFSPAINRPGREADHLNPSISGVKNEWSYTSKCFHGLHKENFALPSHFNILLLTNNL